MSRFSCYSSHYLQLRALTKSTADQPGENCCRSRNRDVWMATEKRMHWTLGLNSDCGSGIDLCESALRAGLGDLQDRMTCEGGNLNRIFEPRRGNLLLLSGPFQDSPYGMMKHGAYDRKMRDFRIYGEIPFDTENRLEAKSTHNCFVHARIGCCPWIMLPPRQASPYARRQQAPSFHSNTSLQNCGMDSRNRSLASPAIIRQTELSK